MVRDELDDADKAKMFSLLESLEPMTAAIQSIRAKLNDLESAIDGSRH